MRRATILLIVATAFLLGLAGPAGATWSVVGADPETGEVGVAIASCVPVSAVVRDKPSEPLFLVALVPGVGAGVSQADANDEAPPQMAELLELGKTAEEVIAEVSGDNFDDRPQARQHGVARLDGDASGFTGTDNGAFAGDKQDANVSVQGNILVSEAVIEDALTAFNSASDLPLADRLVAALLAGSEAGGDSRCAETALFAHLAVASPGDDPMNPTVLLTYGSMSDGDNPVLALSQDFASGARQKVVTPSAGTPFVKTIGLAIGALLIFILVFRWRKRQSSLTLQDGGN